MALVALIAVKVVVGFAGPLGINKLLEYVKPITNADYISDLMLRYIENNGKDATIRPWVWISFLFIGPVVGTMAIQWYIFINVSPIKPSYCVTF